MNRLRAELCRLYAAACFDGREEAAAPEPTASPVVSPSGAAAARRLMEGIDLIGPANEVRALVVEVMPPVAWTELGKLWQGVQTEFEWPPPAIAVSGVDGLQLWFSLDRPVPVPRGHDILDLLTRCFLPEVRPRHLRIWPARDGTASRQDLHARWVPAEQGASGNWSAFVAPDLAPIFAETPWLDLPPGEDGQSSLLRSLRGVSPANLEAACQRLRSPADDAQPTPPALPIPLESSSAPASAGRAPASGERAPASAGRAPASGDRAPATPSTSAERVGTAADDPVRFLRQVMNDDTVPLALRLEAAKALLPR